jgi:hypothetical protein
MNGLRKLQKLNLAFKELILILFVVALFAVIGPIALLLKGATSLCAVALSALICLAGAASAICVCHLMNKTGHALQGMLWGISLGTGFPLVFGIIVHFFGGPLSTAGFIYYLLIFYLPTLTLKTILVLPPSR